jgi:hypothetical protein
MSTKVDGTNSMVSRARVRMSAAWVGLAVVCWSPAAATAQAQPARPADGASAADSDDDHDDDAAVAARPWFQGTTEEQRGRARAVFLDGNELIMFPDYARAAAKYSEAIEIWDNPAFHYNLAIAQINLLRPTEAYNSLKRAVRHGSAPLGEDKHHQALVYMASLEAQLARLHITCDQPEVLVVLDGRPLFMGPDAYVDYVQPGGHQLVATKDGYDTESRELVASPGQPLEVELHLSKPEQVSTVRKWAAWKPWVVVGAGAVFLGGAAYFDLQSSRAFDDFDEDFTDRCPTGCPDTQVPDVTRRLDSAATQQKIARTTYAIGGAVLATGVILLYVNRERIVRSKGESDTNAVSLIPSVSSGAAHIDVRLRF